VERKPKPETFEIIIRRTRRLDPVVLRCDACRQPMAAIGFDSVETLSCELPADVLNRTVETTDVRYGMWRGLVIVTLRSPRTL
jgi:hypothetical protein